MVRMPPRPSLRIGLGVAPGPGAGVELVLEADDAPHRVEVEAAPVDEGAHRGQRRLAHGEVPGEGPGLEQRLALPGAAEGLVVGLEGAHTVDQGAAAALGAKRGVHPEHEAVGGGLGEDPAHGLGEAGVALEGGAAPGGLAVGVVDVEDVDVAGEVELEAPELPHGQDAEPRAHRAAVGVLAVRGGAELGVDPRREDGERPVDGGAGQRRELAHDLHQPPPAGEVPEDDARHLPGAVPAQDPHQPVHRVVGEGIDGRQAPVELPAHPPLGLRAVEPPRGGEAVHRARPPAQTPGQRPAPAAEGAGDLEPRRAPPGGVAGAAPGPGSGEVGGHRQAPVRVGDGGQGGEEGVPGRALGEEVGGGVEDAGRVVRGEERHGGQGHPSRSMPWWRIFLWRLVRSTPRASAARVTFQSQASRVARM